MPEYLCTDGPIAGQLLDWPDGTAPGQILTVALVDVGQPDAGPDAEPEADYRIERLPEATLPGVLRFVAGRGLWGHAATTTPLLEV